MNEYEVLVSSDVARTYHVTAESPDRAVELIAEGEEEREGETVVHVQDKEVNYIVVDVSLLDKAVCADL